MACICRLTCSRGQAQHGSYSLGCDGPAAGEALRRARPCGADFPLANIDAESNVMQGRNVILTWYAFGAIVLSLGAVADAQEVYRDLQPGSFLVFPVFDITQGFITQLHITNTDPMMAVQIQLDFVCPGSRQDPFCDALTRHLTIIPSGALVLDVEEFHPPCNQGYIVVFAENAMHQAISFNALIGSYNITRRYREHDGGAEQAITIQSVKPFNEVLGESGVLQFGPHPNPATQDYAALATQLFTSFRAVGGSEKVYGSDLILLTLNTMIGAPNPASLVVIDFWNENAVAFSASLEFVCWTQVRVDEIDFNFVSANLGTLYGSMTIIPAPNCPLPGGCPPLTPFDPAVLGAIRGLEWRTKRARNLYHDELPKSAMYLTR